MGNESIPPPTPLSPEEKAIVHDNVAFLRQEWGEKANTDGAWLATILQAVDGAESGKAPDLPENLWPIFNALKQTRGQLVDFLQQAWLEEEARRRTTPRALALARDGYGNRLSDPFGLEDDIECGF